ncbi:MAG: BlaI/MecI/CopY family transcriptional regulator [Bacteroidota bacterium]
MSDSNMVTLSRRERQIMDVLYKEGRATAAAVLDAIPDPPSYSAVRALLRILVEKGHVYHEQEGPRYVYLPTVSRERAKKSAMRRVLDTFFEGSTTQAVAALLDMDEDVSSDELSRLEKMINEAKREGR